MKREIPTVTGTVIKVKTGGEGRGRARATLQSVICGVLERMLPGPGINACEAAGGSLVLYKQ